VVPPGVAGHEVESDVVQVADVAQILPTVIIVTHHNTAVKLVSTFLNMIWYPLQMLWAGITYTLPGQARETLRDELLTVAVPILFGM
jgi:hypothetical protein